AWPADCARPAARSSTASAAYPGPRRRKPPATTRAAPVVRVTGMRLDLVGDNLFERLLARTNIGPWPLVHTQGAYTLARVIMAATRLGIFEALERSPRSAAEIAASCRTDPVATDKLLFALACSGYAKQ